MKQLGLGLNLSTKKTRKREFLEEMERVVPWAALVQIVAQQKNSQGSIVENRCRRVRRLAEGVAALIRIDTVWLAVDPVDMRAGPNTPAGARGRGVRPGAVKQCPHKRRFDMRSQYVSDASSRRT